MCAVCRCLSVSAPWLPPIVSPFPARVEAAKISIGDEGSATEQTTLHCARFGNSARRAARNEGQVCSKKSGQVLLDFT